MSADGSLAIVIQLLAGLSLAACCGLRAFLPPLIIGLAVRLEVPDLILGQPLALNPSFDWISTTPALIVFGSAVVLEVLADKIPVVDHVLDAIETVIRPLAGFLVVAASLHGLEPLPAVVLGLILGGGVAGGVHLAKTKIRVLSTLGTGGLASPVLSVFEDVLAFCGSVLAVVAAVAAATLILIGLIVTVIVLRRYVRRVRHIREDLTEDPTG